MKIQTNVRAGAGNQKRNSGADSSTVVVVPVPVYYPPVSRCTGI